MGWPYQALVHEGDKRLGFYLEGDEMIVGSYRTTLCLGSTLGIIPYGKGRIIYSTLDVVDNLLSQEPAAEVARKLFAICFLLVTGKVICKLKMGSPLRLPIYKLLLLSDKVFLSS